MGGETEKYALGQRDRVPCARHRAADGEAGSGETLHPQLPDSAHPHS
jgi:hypothetical protein